MAFGKAEYDEYPYINIDANGTNDTNIIKLTDLFEYQDLEIPPPAPSAPSPATEKYSILNIKKQFICVKFKKPAAGNSPEVYGSRIYVKKETIKLPLKLIVLTSEKADTISANYKINFKVNSGNLELEYTSTSSTNDQECKNLFEAVYKQIENEDHTPYFGKSPNAFLGGNKRGGTRKVGGSRSR